MSDVASSRALRVGAACILGVLGLLAARAHFASADAAQPGATTAAESAQCGAAAGAEAFDATVAEAMEQVRREQAAAGPDADSGWVVLNNRGYNYGPPPAPRIDAQLFAGEQAGAGQR
jgi:hypothetical protein